MLKRRDDGSISQPRPGLHTSSPCIYPCIERIGQSTCGSFWLVCTLIYIAQTISLIEKILADELVTEPQPASVPAVSHGPAARPSSFIYHGSSLGAQSASGLHRDTLQLEGGPWLPLCHFGRYPQPKRYIPVWFPVRRLLNAASRLPPRYPSSLSIAQSRWRPPENGKAKHLTRVVLGLVWLHAVGGLDRFGIEWP